MYYFLIYHRQSGLVGSGMAIGGTGGSYIYGEKLGTGVGKPKGELT